MPNPYVENDRAAAFLADYGSERMVRRSVDRLYRGGVQSQQVTRARAQLQAYPPRPAVRRTPAEIEAYLQSRVAGELLRRQQRLAALEREAYPERAQEAAGAAPALTPEALAAHLNRVYTAPLRRRAMREAEIERVFGPHRDPSAPPPPPRSMLPLRPAEGGGDDEAAALQRVSLEEFAQELRQREAGWRPVRTPPRRRDDYLVHDYDRLQEAGAKGPAAAGMWQPRTNSKRRLTARERAEWLDKLARPVSITPRVVSESAPANAPPEFQVHRKTE